MTSIIFITLIGFCAAIIQQLVVLDLALSLFRSFQ